MNLTKYEQETIINFHNGTAEASIYTASPRMMKRLDGLARDFPENYRLTGQTEVSKTYSCDKNLITLRKPRKENEKHREWASRRMKEINIQKNMEKES